ncbi:DHA2 family efflux MFS transporter permease subunit [Microbacterium azadirachtae]|uniref:Putative transport protein HsrA n=1 Tax=Microbacterium azadirachtae TaxID=582680 RepID=A0A0F0KIZ2_9MICO|nr:MDR family MFS transporter [Microbacterium azadirachtae]KJL20833.1 putative transport protein HsrA [Microbacterium azadirachtae]UXW86993.1 DHA2 family efflux MFS transporter permease subunit [Microbacterium azadirachtae]
MSAIETGSVPTSAGSALIPRRDMAVIWVLLAAAFVAILNETTMSMAIPHLIDDLSITPLAAQWVTSAFMLTMAVVIPTTGFLLQRFTTRQMFLGALALFSAGTLIAALAPGFTVLLIARIVQASGTAIMMPLLMTTLMNLVPPATRGRMMGRVSIVISLAPAIGPTLSGFLLDHFSWRAIFVVVLPIALAAMLIGWRWLTNVGERTDAPLDVLSIVLSAFGFGGLVFGLSQIGALAGGGGTAAPLVIALVVGVLGLIAFLWRQVILQRKDDALLDLRVFASRDFTLSMVQMFLLSLAFFGTLTVIPLFLQKALGLETTEAGLVLLPGALAMGLLGPVIGRIYDARGTKVLLIPGSILTAATLWFYTTLSTTTSVWIVLVAQTLLSIGLALSFTPLFTASLASLKPKFYSYGSAVIGTVQQVAGAAGIAVMIAVFTLIVNANGGTEVADAVAAGSRSTFVIGAVIATVTILGAFIIRKPEDQPHGDSPGDEGSAPAMH